jgi:hypothetical protein
VKIGVTGTGKYPAFRILRIDGSGTEIHEGAYYDSGAPMPDADPKSANWSSVSMSYEEVDALFRERTKWIRKVG